MLDRIGDWKHHLKEAVLLNMEGKKMSKTDETSRLCVGVDLHKTQFTVCAINEDGEYLLEKWYKKFAAYVGIVPSVHNSNESNHYGRITKHGPQELWTAFVQAALGMIRLTKVTSEWRLIKEYQRRKDDKGSGRAIIALARKITRVVFVMLSKRERFNPNLMRCVDNVQETA